MNPTGLVGAGQGLHVRQAVNMLENRPERPLTLKTDEILRCIDRTFALYYSR